MSNFNDFDLDLKDVSEDNTTATFGSTLVCLASKLTSAQKCNSVETPTTGMTSACCRKKASDVEPQCI